MTNTRFYEYFGWSSGGGSITAGFVGDVFNRTIEVSDTKLQLIGFRSIDKKTVFWLGVGIV